jgi:hypothetical protein
VDDDLLELGLTQTTSRRTVQSRSQTVRLERRSPAVGRATGAQGDPREHAF